MTLFNKNKGNLTLQDLFSNEILQASLEKLNWEHAEDQDSVYEVIRIKDIEKESLILYVLINSIDIKAQYGDYRYSKRFNKLLIRTSDKIKRKKKWSQYTVSEPFTILYDRVKDQLASKTQQEEGVVLKVE